MDKLIAAFLAMLLSFNVSAAVVPVTPMQNAVSGVIQQKMIKRGFAANDPRFSATLNASSGVLSAAAGGGAAAVVAGAITAPAWITAAVAAGIGAVVSYGVYLALDGAVQWLFGDSSSTSVQVTGNSTGGDPLLPSFAPMVSGGEYYSWYWSHAGSAAAAFYAWFRDPSTGYCGSGGADCATPTNLIVEYQVVEEPWGTGHTRYQVLRQSYWSWDPPPGFVHQFYAVPSYSSSGAPASCSAGQVYSAGSSSCVGIPLAATQVSNDGVKTFQEAIDTLSTDEKAKPLNPELVAAIANRVMQQAAAQPGYAGVPVPLSDPVTSADVQAWRADNPASYPTVGDAVSPQPLANSPYSLPSGAPQAQQDPAIDLNPVVNPAASSPQVNLGADPGIGAPGLEEIPTAAQILAPLLGMFPDFRGYVVPDHNAVCPAPSGDLFGQSFVLDGHCNLLDGVRPTLTLVMAAVWLMLSTFVVLRA